MSQKALAERLHVAQSEISKAESGKKIPGEDFLGSAASFFGYAPAFFAQTNVVLPEGGIRHRKRSALSATVRARIEAEALARMMDVSVFAKDRGGLASDLPPREGRNPVEMARALRVAWCVPPGPVEKLVALLERHKVFVLSFDFGTDLLDAFALPQPDPEAPVCIALNANPAFPADRQRFTLAHELGHVVLHREEFADESDEKRQEKDANQFAGEFLAPGADIGQDLAPPLTFARLRELKSKWKMSMGALVRRAYDLKVVKDADYKRIQFFFGRYGYRKREPDMGLVRETPRGVSWLAGEFVAKHGADAPAALCLAPALFARRYPAAIPSTGGIAVT
ncbi:MAG: ImmA/IrrE family metallo-endopeptidase [Kiritimatiellae bacterium]|nr:ImmA/IrrE family metallo-endopeptidase [Kiritimatiellia bacterium]